jgi:hypothetical protein
VKPRQQQQQQQQCKLFGYPVLLLVLAKQQSSHALRRPMFAGVNQQLYDEQKAFRAPADSSCQVL